MKFSLFIHMERTDPAAVLLQQPGLRDRPIGMPQLSSAEQLAAELRITDSDDFYGRVLSA